MSPNPLDSVIMTLWGARGWRLTMCCQRLMNIRHIPGHDVDHKVGQQTWRAPTIFATLRTVQVTMYSRKGKFAIKIRPAVDVLTSQSWISVELSTNTDATSLLCLHVVCSNKRDGFIAVHDKGKQQYCYRQMVSLLVDDVQSLCCSLQVRGSHDSRDFVPMAWCLEQVRRATSGDNNAHVRR